VKITHVRITNYRCLKSIELAVDAYTPLIGTNGTGKSSVLYALDWFFNGGDLTESDLHSGPLTEADEGRAENSADPRIEVEVMFDQLNDSDRRELGRYARGETVRLRKSWTMGGKPKMVGNSMQGPAFAAVRGADGVVKMRDLYKGLRNDLAELPTVTAKDDILSALTEWEDRPANQERLVSVEDDDVTHAFGFAGEDVLARRFRLILVPAAVDIAGAIGTAGKGSVLSQLIGTLTTGAVGAARRAWEAKHQEPLAELEAAIRQSVEDATHGHVLALNRHFSDLVPNGAVRFVGEPPEWALRGEATVRADVTVNGTETDVGRQGHGVQRALMMAVLQTMVGVDGEPAPAGGPVTAEIPNLDDAPRASPPALLLCMEEPEIYQHPVRARHFARVLNRLAGEVGSQVLLATHSPYFVLPSQFASLRRFSVDQGVAHVVRTSVEEIATACDGDEERILRCVQKELPRTFSEGFFADAVVLVEGDTDRVVVETLAERLQRPLDAHGVAVLAMDSKQNLRVPAAILTGLGVPVYVVADGDALGGQRKHPDDAERASNVTASHRSATETLLKWLPSDVEATCGALPAAFGGPTTVTSRWTLFHDDLESELASWSEFESALIAAGAELRDKNLATYRNASYTVELDTVPDGLRQMIAAIGLFGS
jgi:putative ATP-dependent endonuclease of OLD family